jgi:hypothetical protein
MPRSLPDAVPVPEEPSVDAAAMATALDADGYAVLPGLLNPVQCAAIAGLYACPDRFRSRVVMARHGFGRGEYQYFAYPLPPLLDRWRHSLYAVLAPIANRWNHRMGIDLQYPLALDAFLSRCREAGQTRPTPLLLAYGPGDYNCLHQDLYGEHVFPLQVAVLLSVPGQDFDGGELVLTEQAASAPRARVVPLRQGDAVAFPVHQRPVAGRRGGVRRAVVRHGVSRILRGQRYTVGLIFHDAR